MLYNTIKKKKDSQMEKDKLRCKNDKYKNNVTLF